MSASYFGLVESPVRLVIFEPGLELGAGISKWDALPDVV